MPYQKKRGWLNPERREQGGFAPLPHCLLESQIYINLPSHAIKLLNDLLTQFRGFNNGDLCLAWSIMKKRGWKSRDTLNKARKELLDVEIIMVSRHGDRKRPHLYALTFFAIDECKGKLDIKETKTPLSTWRLHEPPPTLKIRLSPTLGGLNKGDITRMPCKPNNESALYNTPTVSNQPISETL